MQVGVSRHKQELIQALESVFYTASTVGGKTGCKDTFQEHFLEKMAESYKGISGHTHQQDALNKCIASFPNNILSPVWRLEGEFLL